MEKLTIKELAPYLPYGFKVQITENKAITEVLSIDAYKFHGQIRIETALGAWGCSYFKPLLRPISQLTEEINWDNQTYAITDLFEIGDDGGYIYEYDHGNINLISQLKTIAEYNCHHDINYLPHPVVQVLIEHHFDVFGLIDRGLALPIDGKEVESE